MIFIIITPQCGNLKFFLSTKFSCEVKVELHNGQSKTKTPKKSKKKAWKMVEIGELSHIPHESTLKMESETVLKSYALSRALL